MINRLRKKFIILTTCSVLAVLILIVGMINIVNYSNVVKRANQIVMLLKDGGGTFGGGDGNTGDNRPPNDDSNFKPQRPISPETPFETRYFTIVLDYSGTVMKVNTDQIVSVSDSQAVNYATSLYEKGKHQGFYKNYRYGTRTDNENNVMYIFVDCTKELTSFKNFMIVSFVVGFSAFVIIFILVFFLSGKIMKPIAESYEKQKRFITDASHEIKTPLTVIGANTEVLEMQGIVNEWTESIKEQVKRLSSLTEKLVFLARMDEESQTLKVVDFLLSDTVEEAIKPFYSVAISKGLKFDSDIQKNIFYCGDESLIRQLVSILVDNALKYSEENGKVFVGLKTVGGKVQLVVFNPAKEMNGDLNILFERFYRNDKSRNSETGGHGIGLSVAKAIVEIHKGKIIAQGENGIVSFIVTL